jgi:phosphoglycerate dehydrogenase-like enzyme
MNKIKIAILDDYQQVALKMADWSVLKNVEITVFSDHEKNLDALVARLMPFHILCVMRERTPLSKEILSALPNLKFIVSTGRRNASIDMKAAEDLGINIEHTGYVMSGAPELTWALLMAAARNIITENANFRSGKWQTTIGIDLEGKTLGIVGLGNIGTRMAGYARAFDMRVIAWSENLTKEKAEAAGAQWVSKEELFRQSDFVSIHLVLSNRSRGIIGEDDLQRMKSTAYLINTSRGPLIDETALISVLKQKKIAGAILDVFNEEPLPENHILRQLDNLLATPHIGYVTEKTYQLFYEDSVKLIQSWLVGK